MNESRTTLFSEDVYLVASNEWTWKCSTSKSSAEMGLSRVNGRRESGAYALVKPSGAIFALTICMLATGPIAAYAPDSKAETRRRLVEIIVLADREVVIIHSVLYTSGWLTKCLTCPTSRQCN